MNYEQTTIVKGVRADVKQDTNTSAWMTVQITITSEDSQQCYLRYFEQFQIHGKKLDNYKEHYRQYKQFQVYPRPQPHIVLLFNNRNYRDHYLSEVNISVVHYMNCTFLYAIRVNNNFMASFPCCSRKQKKGVLSNKISGKLKTLVTG